MVSWEDSWLALEISSKCNLRCPVCSQFNILKKDKGHMSLNLFKKIVDDLFKDKAIYETYPTPLYGYLFCRCGAKGILN